jgi:arsenite methyltransferase
VDIGAGPGLLAVEMATAVGPGGLVHAVEPSESMRAHAGMRARSRDAADVAIAAGSANALPLPDASVDVAVSTQVLEYVGDVPGALAEAHRVLRAGGRVLVLDTDWDSIVWHSRDDARTPRGTSTSWTRTCRGPSPPRCARPGSPGCRRTSSRC